MFYILYLLFETVIKNSLIKLDPKRYCYKFKLYNISDFFICKIFFIFKVVLSMYKLVIQDVFLNKYYI